MYNCKVVTDSFYSTRITSLELEYPRFIHSEVLTHRDRARNAGSSRAIPHSVMIHGVVTDPVIPIYWGANQKGMQTGNEIGLIERIQAELVWLEARDRMVEAATTLSRLGVHKSLSNRLLEPWMWIKVVMTATTWKNFFDQRCHPDAEIHFQKIAGMMKECLEKSEPKELKIGEWHLPYIQEDDRVLVKENICGSFDNKTLGLVSVARCARVAYMQHGQTTKNLKKDLQLAQDLIHGSGELGHRSPFEHVALGKENSNYQSGPFTGWHQLRKDYWNE
jgi:hypothetical protein